MADEGVIRNKIWVAGLSEFMLSHEYPEKLVFLLFTHKFLKAA